MRGRKGILVMAVVVATLAGHAGLAEAAKRIPLTEARYAGEVTTHSAARVRMDVATTEPRSETWSAMATSGGVYIPLAGKVKTEYLFSAADQQALADIVASELQRLGITGAGDGEPRDIQLALAFESGTFKHSVNTYTLVVAMTLVDGDHRFERRYDLDSHATLTGWQKLNISVWKGKVLLVQAALDALVPDIQAFLAASADAQKENP